MELFISDLDGTLLNGNAEVTEFTRDTLNRLMAKGLNFTAATARTLASAGKILSGLDLKLPVILMNGVLIYDMTEKKYVKINSLSILTKIPHALLLRSHRREHFKIPKLGVINIIIVCDVQLFIFFKSVIQRYKFFFFCNKCEVYHIVDVPRKVTDLRERLVIFLSAFVVKALHCR